MRQLIIFLLLSIASSQNTTRIDDETLAKWIRVADETLSSVSLLAPLRSEFTPDYLAKRSREHCITRQMGRLRAQAASAMIETLTDEARVCPPPHLAATTLEAFKEELEALGFTAYVVKGVKWCTYTYALLIQVPQPVVGQTKEDL